MASQSIYQFYAVLRGYKPKIWRRFQVMQNITLARLAYILMTLFEMKASHLFLIDVPYRKNARLSYPEAEEDFYQMFSEHKYFTILYDFLDDFGQEYLDASAYKLYKMLANEKEELNFEYDFGDGWEVYLKVEIIFDDKNLPGKELPRVIDGQGFGIVEDCGGISGLTSLRKAFKKKSGQVYKELSEWLGIEDLDLDAFDMDDMNFRLKKIPRIYCDVYEKMLYPTERSLKILSRQYEGAGQGLP